jgi:fatty-acyl-CoA synthase
LWREGFLHTGDVARIEESGYITITDRIKDVIKVGGEWLSSLELEDILNLHPAVSEVAVIGMADDKWGEKPLALITLKEGQAEPPLKEMVNHVKAFIDKGLMSKLALLLQVRYVSAIAKTSVGKIDKKVMREQQPG